jgi:hypothetical protein
MDSEERRPELSRLLGDEEPHIKTVGVDFAVKVVKTRDGRRIKLQIWSLNGSGSFDHIRGLYYKNSLGAIFLYFVSKQHTGSYDIRHLRKLMTEYNKVCGTDTPKILVTILKGSWPDVSSASGRRGSRAIINSVMDLPVDLSDVDRKAIAGLVNEESKTKMIVVDPFEVGGFTFVLEELAADITDFAKSLNGDTYSKSNAGSRNYDALYKVVLMGDENGFCFKLPIRSSKAEL